MISAGIDPGTSSYDIVAIDGERVVFHANIPTEEVRRNPSVLMEAIKESGAEVVAGLSGYGLPFKKFAELDEVDIFLMTLNFDRESSIGLRNLVEVAKKEEMNIYTVPGVIHLPTVPAWRKINRIDMGTADKLSSTVLASYQLSKKIPPDSQNFILAEIGFGFSAFIAVKKGKIVDGIGGTSGFPGYTSLGAMDAELAYLIGSFPKKMIFSGGVQSFVRDCDLKHKEIEILSEFVLKGLRAVEVSVEETELCVLSGKFADELNEMISHHYKTVLLRGFGEGKQSAQGAAIIANGIAGGEFKWLIEQFELTRAKGTVLDYVTSDVFDHLREGLKRKASE
jgi:predicted butyrate kinase (DUF1464 family)